MSATFSPRPEESPSISELATGIVGDIQNLANQHLALFRNEMKQDMRKAADAATSLAIGMAVTQIGGFLLCLMFVHLLSQFSDFPLWACYGVIGGVVILIGTTAVINGLNKLARINALSEATAETIREDSEWLAKNS